MLFILYLTKNLKEIEEEINRDKKVVVEEADCIMQWFYDKIQYHVRF